MVIVKFLANVGIWILLFAVLEALIEGKNGWAAALATGRYHWDPEDQKLTYRPFGKEEWRVEDKTKRWSRFIIWYIGILDGKDWTWYHRVVDAIQIYIAHMQVYLYFQGSETWVILEFRVVATVMLIWSLEDALWFYVNPEAAKSDHHKNWKMVGQHRLMDAGMFILFRNGLIVMTLTFILPNLWYWLSPYLYKLL